MFLKWGFGYNGLMYLMPAAIILLFFAAYCFAFLLMGIAEARKPESYPGRKSGWRTYCVWTALAVTFLLVCSIASVIGTHYLMR